MKINANGNLHCKQPANNINITQSVDTKVPGHSRVYPNMPKIAFLAVAIEAAAAATVLVTLEQTCWLF